MSLFLTITLSILTVLYLCVGVYLAWYALSNGYRNAVTIPRTGRRLALTALTFAIALGQLVAWPLVTALILLILFVKGRIR